MKACQARLAIISIFALSASAAHANVTRCNNGLVSVGDSKPAVLQKCGDPSYKDSYCKPGSGGGGAIAPVTGAGGRPRSMVVGNGVPACVVIDEWTYVPNPGEFMTTMRFEAGAVTTIISGDRVP